MTKISLLPSVLWREIQSYLKHPRDWIAFVNSSKVLFSSLKYETIELKMKATDILQSRQLPEIFTRIAHPELQVHLKLDILALQGADSSWEFRNSNSLSSSEKLNEFVSWFLSCTPARSLTWESGTDIIDQIPASYDALGRFERLTIKENQYNKTSGTTIDLSRLSENNRVRVLTLDHVEFVPFGCQGNLTQLRELNILNSWRLDVFLQPRSDWPARGKYKFKDNLPHPFAEYSFPGLQKLLIDNGQTYQYYQLSKFSHVRDVSIVGSAPRNFAVLKNLSSFSFTNSQDLGGSSTFDEMVAQSNHLKRFTVWDMRLTGEEILSLAGKCQLSHLDLTRNYLSEDLPYIPTLRYFRIRAPPGKFSDCSNLHHLFSVELIDCPEVKTLNGLNQVSVVKVEKCGLESLEGLRGEKYHRSISIIKCPHIKDFSPLSNVKKVMIEYCDGFTDCSQVKGVKDLTLSFCEKLLTLGSLPHCQSLTLIRMEHLDSLASVRDVPELYIRYFMNNKLLYDLGGAKNKKLSFAQVGDVPEDLPYLQDYLKFEVFEEYFGYRYLSSFYFFERNEKLSATSLLKCSGLMHERKVK